MHFSTSDCQMAAKFDLKPGLYRADDVAFGPGKADLLGA